MGLWVCVRIMGLRACVSVGFRVVGCLCLCLYLCVIIVFETECEGLFVC